MKSLFAQVDANGDGRSAKRNSRALGAGGTNTDAADNVFSRMDGDSDGAVSLDEMLSALKGKRHRHHHHVDGGSGDAGDTDGANSDLLLQAVQSASSTSVSNSDGSTTTSLTYADGSTVTMTSPAKAAASGAATSSYNFIEQMIAREARAISTATTALFSISA